MLMLTYYIYIIVMGKADWSRVYSNNVQIIEVDILHAAVWLRVLAGCRICTLLLYREHQYKEHNAAASMRAATGASD